MRGMGHEHGIRQALERSNSAYANLDQVDLSMSHPGEKLPMRKTPTIYDVAERAGVSKSLVSLVLRDSPRVSAEKRAAVLSAVADLDYTPSRLAAGLAGTRTRSIGVVIDDFENLWFATALAGLRESFAGGGYSLSVADIALNAHLSLNPLEVFRSLRVDGLVLAGEVPRAAVERFTAPTVILGTRAISAGVAPVIASDETAGGCLAVRHLADLGHRSIACVSASGASAAAREAGYLAEMRERNLAPQVLRAEQTSEAAARTAVSQVFTPEGSAAPLPTAVFAVNDPMAVGVIGAAQDRGLRVPQDLSVVGYDNSPLAAYELIALTSVSGDMRELGRAAGRTLAELIEGSGGAELSSRAPELLEPRMAVRSSTAPLGY